MPPKRDPRIINWLVPCLLLASSLVEAQEEAVLSDFEQEGELASWYVTAAESRLTAEGATHGERALELVFDPTLRWRGCTIQWASVPADWSAYDALVLDVTNPGERPLTGSVLVGDRAWQDKGTTYWNRHNGPATFAPGTAQWVIPIHGLYRGEAGSRNNDISRNIDPDQIVRVDLSFGQEGESGRVIVDNVRLVRTARPEGVWAFDFGPPSQSVMLGWTPVSNQSAYDAAAGFGWVQGTPWDGAARDTTFGPMLTRDFCEAGGYPFRVDVPPGDYRLTLIYENCGYWGGEQARHSERRVLVDGMAVHEETRPDGAAHSLYRFEDVEPIGADLWDTYMAPELTRPVQFDARAGGDGLVLRCESDDRWGSKLSGVALHRTGDEAAARWVDGQMAALADEFRRAAVCLDPPAPPFEPPAAWAGRPLVAWPVRMEDDVTPYDLPPADGAASGRITLRRPVARGELESFCFAVRPLRDLGPCKLVLTMPQAEPRGIHPLVQVVRYGTSRGFNSIAYRIRPHTVRPAEEVDLPAGVTREIVLTLRVGADAPAGVCTYELSVVDAEGTAVLTAGVDADVRPVTLDRGTGYLMGYFGLYPPGLLPPERQAAALEETLSLLRRNGMNAVSGGPNWRLTGWQDGRPQIDFGEMDSFFALLKEHGFTDGLNGYGGARFVGLHDGYVKGAAGERVEQQSGLPYKEALMRAWGAVDEHARAAGWPVIYYAMCDETRVREQAERELEFMRMMAKVSAAYPDTVRTSGSYSVDYNSRPTDQDDLNYWHQRFFEALDVSSLNNHDGSVMDEARRLGKEIQIYNQGRTRYSFGLYQWSEFSKGVRARWQWHLNVLHGYQFFDLDGREPDTAMICYGRNAIYPTIHFERCREGAEDFYLYNALWQLVQRERDAGRAGAAVDAGEKLLEDAVARVRISERGEPAWFDADAFKAEVLAAIEALQGT